MTDPSLRRSPGRATGSAPRLADRYGTSRRGRRLGVAAVGVVVLAFLGWLAWSTWSYATPDVRSELVSWDVQGQHEAVATVDVRLEDSSVVAACTLRAFAEDHTVVGERAFEVPGPDDTGDGPVQISIRTERRATSVDLVGCTTSDQARPR